jgi:O-antigen/teichoic acid export membrane protein
VRARLAWTVAGQVVGAADFGSFALAFVAFSFAVGTSRSLVTDALLIRFSAASTDRWRVATGGATGAALLVAAVAAVVCLALGLVVSGLAGAALVTVAALLPGLLLQDAWRQAFFAAGRPAAAFVNDLVWAALQLPAILVLSTRGAGVVPLLLAWGVPGGVAAVVGIWQARVLPSPSRGVRWLVANRDLGLRLAADFVLNQGAVNLAIVLIGAIVGIAAVGAIRGAQTLLGPVQIAFFALTSFGVPFLARRWAEQSRLVREAAALSAVSACGASVWVAVLMLLPTAVGAALLGDSWDGAHEVLPWVGLQFVALGVALGAGFALRAQARAGAQLRITLVQAPLLLGLGALGSSELGVVGAAAGFALAQAVGAALCWLALLRVPAGRSSG